MKHLTNNGVNIFINVSNIIILILNMYGNINKLNIINKKNKIPHHINNYQL